MLLEKKIHIPPYDFTLYLVVVTEEEEVKTSKLIGKRKDIVDIVKEYTNFYGLTLSENHEIVILIRIGKYNKVNIVATLAHEILHGIHDIFRQLGIKFDVNNQEPSAYLMSYMMEQSLPLIDKYYTLKANEV